MAGDSPPSPAVAGRDIAVGISGKSSPVGAVAGGGDEICKNGQSGAVGVECLLDPSVPVAATEDKITVSTAVAGDGPNVGSGCGLYVGVGAGISSDGSNGHSSTDSAVIESDSPDLQPQDTNLVLETGNLERGGFESRKLWLRPIDPYLIPPRPLNAPRRSLSARSPVFGRRVTTSFPVLGASARLFETGNLEEGIGLTSVPNSMGGNPVLPPVDEGGLPRHLPGAIGFSSMPDSMFGTLVLRTLARLLGTTSLTSVLNSMGMGDTLVIQTGDVEAGHLLIGTHFGVGRSDRTPMNDDYRMYIVNEPQTGNSPPPLEISGDNSHLVRPLEQRSNCFVILFVTSEILGMVFEIIYQESHIMPYFVIWIVCVTIAMSAARLLADIEGGMANREQFAVYLRCFSFFLLELLQYWGIHQGNYVIALKIILKVTGAVIGWWVVGVLQSYMDAFGMHLPLRRCED